MQKLLPAVALIVLLMLFGQVAQALATRQVKQLESQIEHSSTSLSVSKYPVLQEHRLLDSLNTLKLTELQLEQLALSEQVLQL